MESLTTEPRRRRSLIPDFIRFENDGDRAAGKLIAKQESVGADGNPMNQYIMEDYDRGLIKFLAPVQVLEGLAGVEMGTHVEIIYKGESRTGTASRRVKIFEIWELDLPTEND